MPQDAPQLDQDVPPHVTDHGGGVWGIKVPI
ncbi:hypothetical protein SSAG_06402, partial [Streptomyces sp. Mg1]